jgi:hypothetical protein
MCVHGVASHGNLTKGKLCAYTSPREVLHRLRWFHLWPPLYQLMPLTSNLCPINSWLLSFLHGLSVSFFCSLSCQQPSTLHVDSQVPQLHPSSALPLPSSVQKYELYFSCLLRSWTWIYSCDVVCCLCLDSCTGHELLWLVGGWLCMGSRIGRTKVCINVCLFCSSVREGMCMASPRHTLLA